MTVSLKKGAMFGLDARIALAIFGALSVISGAALYSAIQHSKVVQFVTQVEEISKATDEFRISTGKDIIRSTHLYTGSIMANMQYIAALLTNLYYNDAGWNGPYLTGFTRSTGTLIEKNGIGYGNVYYHNNMFDYLSDTSGGLCLVNDRSDCSLYLLVLFPESITGNNSGISFLKSIDRYVDGSDSLLDGKVRILQRNNYGVDLVPFTGSNKIYFYYSLGNLAFLSS